MNNRYLYRAKRIDNGEWVEGHLITDEQDEKKCFIGYVFWTNDVGTPHDYDVVSVDPSTICQCTGLKDKNGNKIWEGDVVKCNYNNYGEKGAYVGKVIFREDNCIFVVTNGKSTDYEWWNEEKEVIGNIFDNADLLGE